MRNRRFLLLAAVLVALNTALWIVPQGLALQQVVVSTLFGKNMVRADVTESNGTDWRIARGVVVTNVLGTLTVREADTKVEAIPTSSSTKVTGHGSTIKLKNVKPGWHVLVTWPVDGTADSIVVEKKK